MAEETLNPAAAAEGTAAPAGDASGAPAEGAANAQAGDSAAQASVLGAAAAASPEGSDQKAAPDAASEKNAAPKEVPTEESVPETYADFEGEEGAKIPASSLGEFTKVAKELGLSQAKAQKLVTALRPTVDSYVNDSAERFGRRWAEQVKTDKELGGADFSKKLGVAVSAYSKFATPELKQMLEATRLGNHPEIIRMFYRIGTAMSQDTGVAGSGAPEPKRRLYPNSNMNF